MNPEAVLYLIVPGTVFGALLTLKFGAWLAHRPKKGGTS